MRKIISHGTVNQMIDSFEGKISQLEGDVSASSSIRAADDIVGYLSPEDEERYIHTLIGDTNTELEDLDILDSWNWEDGEDDLVLTTVKGSEVEEYTVPKDDLKFDWDNMEEDVHYIVRAVTDSEESDDVESAEDVVGATINYDSTDDKSIVVPEYAKNEFYADYQGSFGGDENDIYSLEDLMIMWNSDHSDDPTMSEYDSFEDWWADTKRWMKRVSGPAVDAEDDEMFTDRDGIFGEPGEVISKRNMRNYYQGSRDDDPSLAAFDSFEDWWASTEAMLEPIENATSIRGSYDRDVFYGSGTAGFKEIASKSVPDADGFYTDYTMYRDLETGEYVFVFGDKDVYTPDQGDFDWTCDTEEEAWSWYDNYTGFSDDE